MAVSNAPTVYVWSAKGEFMNEKKEVLKRTSLLLAVASLMAVSVAVVKTTGQEEAKVSDKLRASNGSM